ncbi:uncharacterized protein FYW23_004904 [Sylvia borin]
MHKYQEVPSRPGSLSEGSLQKLPYYTGNSAEGSDTEAAPGPKGPQHMAGVNAVGNGTGRALPGPLVTAMDPVPVPDPPARPEQGTPDGYDDVLDVPQEAPAASTGDISEGVSRHRWTCVLPTGVC